MFGRRLWTRKRGSRLLAAVLACSLVPGPAGAAQTVDGPRELHAQAEANVQQGRSQTESRAAARHFAEAAALYARAAAQIPETAADREVRDELLGKAVNSALEAYRLDSEDRQPLRDALAVVQVHIDALERAYGVEVGGLSEYKDAERRRMLLRGRLGREPAAERPASPGVTGPPSPPAPVEEPTSRPTPSESRPGPTVSPTGSDARPKWSGLRIGVAASGALTGVAFGVALGTGLSVLREPFTGRAYQRIFDIAGEYQVPRGPGDDMCALGRQRAISELVDACDRRDRSARAAVAMTALTVIFTTSTIMFAVLLAKAKRQPRKGLAFAVSPLSGGAFVGAQGRF